MAAYKTLNAEQRAAVDHIDGPVLVIAGPGTGKTQLLSARVANILQKTDTLPQNILCLTFTETGAENMRRRLTSFIGQAAYDVQISTYHGFGADIIRRFPEYFEQTRLEAPVDELSQHQVIAAIVDALSYANPLKQTRHHLDDLISTISEIKRALLSPEDLKIITAENARFLSQASKQIGDIFADFTKMPTKLPAAAPYFEQTLKVLGSFTAQKPANPQFGSLAKLASDELSTALDEAATLTKTKPLTKWKNKWLAKNADNNFVLAGELENQRLAALAGVLESYQSVLEQNGWYDYDDMIIRTIGAMQKHPDLRYTLQEQYLYILLDEYQDTSTAQAKIVQLLTNNPVHEGRPNVMAVGDDDQAIYAFQGANYSNMLEFSKAYKDVFVKNLTENYRSSADILQTATAIADQIESRLTHSFAGMDKTIVQANHKLPPAVIERVQTSSDIAQFDYIAKSIEKLIQSGVNPSEIAVLAPKHQHLEPLVPYLNARNIAVHYEKRENILDAPVVRQLITMSQLVLALASRNEMLADSLWPTVLSYDFWHIATSDIWRLSWKINDNKDLTWAKTLLDSDDENCQKIALLFLTLANKVNDETCETMLDYLTGTLQINPNETNHLLVRSPLRAFYLSTEAMQTQPELFYETLSHLRVLRTKLREHQANFASSLKLADLLNFIQMYEDAGERIISTSPYAQSDNAVQLMTVYKAKGLEFAHVFLPACQDEVWGASTINKGNKLTLPANLAPIRHAGTSEDERLRLLFVALTRAKIGLHLVNYAQNYSGKTTKHLKYFDEIEQADGSFKAMILPPKYQTVFQDGYTPPALTLLELSWQNRHIDGLTTGRLQSLLTNRLANYQISPTHLNSFVDTEYGGPIEFFFTSILRFPEAPSISGQFGNAIHETLEWCQHQVSASGKLPDTKEITNYFAARIAAKKLGEQQTKLETERGQAALRAFVRERGHIFKPDNIAEHNFRHDGAACGPARLTGKIDLLEIDEANKTITVVDYKTGKSHAKWLSDSSLHKYRQQLYFYKLLVEGSHHFPGYTVEKGRLEFIEPDTSGRIQSLDLAFDNQELAHTKKLLTAVWQHILQLQFPAIDNYKSSVAGIKQFESDLIDGIV